MGELVELFIAAGVLVGPALQPVANIIAPSAIKIKVAFILISFFPAQTYATDAFVRQTFPHKPMPRMRSCVKRRAEPGWPAQKKISTSLEMQ
jgi:hypothetical protein